VLSQGFRISATYFLQLMKNSSFNLSEWRFRIVTVCTTRHLLDEEQPVDALPAYNCIFRESSLSLVFYLGGNLEKAENFGPYPPQNLQAPPPPPHFVCLSCLEKTSCFYVSSRDQPFPIS
jgi:hypothetical protein